MSELISRFEDLNIDVSSYGNKSKASNQHSDFNYLYDQNNFNFSNQSRYGDFDKDEDIEGKLFVGGISWQTTEEGLSLYFSQFGALADVALMKDKYTGQPRGFGFIKFQDSSLLDIVLAQGDHKINGRVVDVKRAVRKSEAPGPIRGARPLESNKIFVGGLAPSVSVTDFRQYFESFGVVVDAVVMFDRQTQRSRGFGFVTYQDENVVQTVLMCMHEINGKMVEVKHAEPKDARKIPPFSLNSRGSSFHNLYGISQNPRARNFYYSQNRVNNPYAPSSYSMYSPAVGDAYGSSYGPSMSPFLHYNQSYAPYGNSYLKTTYSEENLINPVYGNSESEYVGSPSTTRSSQYQSILSSYGTGGGLPSSNSYMNYSSLSNQFDDANIIPTGERSEEIKSFSLQY